MADEDARSFVRAAVKNYHAALMGMDGLDGRDTHRWMESLMIIAVFGRGVTSSLDRLKNRDPEFYTWFEGEKKIMASDPLCRWFYDIRTQTLKQGELPSVALSITWNLQVGPEGRTVDPSDHDYTTATMGIIDGPTHHLGAEIADPTVQEYGRLYLRCLERVVRRAVERIEEHPSAP